MSETIGMGITNMVVEYAAFVKHVLVKQAPCPSEELALKVPWFHTVLW